MISKELKIILNHMNEQDKDDIYRYLWHQHVVKDVRENFAENRQEMNIILPESLKEEMIDNIASRYVDGQYDCNLSYWDNIENLLNEEIELQKIEADISDDLEF